MEDRLRILFVDDEVRVLEGLRRLLRPMRSKWDIVVAANAQEALGVLARQVVDIVVSDMRMPGMDGAALLTEVRQRHPGTMRIMLSGQSDREADLLLTGPVQQFLRKPCELSELHTTIDRSLAVRSLVGDPHVRRYLEARPCLGQPIVAGLPFVEALVKDPTGVVGLATVMRAFADVAWMTCGAARIPGWQEACGCFGEAGASAILLCEHLLSVCPLDPGSGPRNHWWRRHGRQVGVLARDIAVAETAPVEVAASSFIAGLLHDAGTLVLVASAPADQRTAVGRPCPAAGSGTSERDILPVDHAQVGAGLAFQWGFPHGVVEAVAFHRFPARGIPAGFTALTAVHVAEALLTIPDGEARPGIPGSLCEAYLAGLGLAHRIEAWTRLADRVMHLPYPDV